MSPASGVAHEDDVTRDFAHTRREAEALIGIAAALLKAIPGPLAWRNGSSKRQQPHRPYVSLIAPEKPADLPG